MTKQNILDECNKDKKIIFIEPRGIKANVFLRGMSMPLLGPIYLATMLKKEGYDVKVYNENILGRDINMHELKADVLCITGLTSTIQRGYQIAMEFKALNPDGRVIIGGVHASFMKEEAGKYGDIIVSGEGESIILDLIKNGSKEKFIDAARVEDMNSIPIPDFSVLRDNKRMRITPIMTSRGCPFRCNFCSVTAMFGRRFRTRDVEKVVQEFRRIKTRTAFFYDDNLCADKQRAINLFGSLEKENKNVKWSAQVRCDAAQDEKLLGKMAGAGCQIAFIGFESVSQKTLDSYNKSQSIDDIKNAIRKFHNYGIKVHGMFVLGSDEDNESIFRKTTKFCNDYDIDSVQYMILTPSPGTQLYQNLNAQNRLLHKKWQFYDGMHVVFKPKLLSPSELQQGAIDCYKDFYTYSKALNGAINVVYDNTINCLKSSGEKLRRYFSKNWDTTILGKYIIRKWLKQNKGYVNYLRTL